MRLYISKPYVSDSRRKDDSQKMKSPQKPVANLFGPPPTDLRDYLTKKKSVNQIATFCCCERLITAMLSECRCSSHVNKQSVFRRLISTSRSAKRRRSHRSGTFSDTEYPEVTTNMASKSKVKQPAVSSDESDAEPEGVYRHIRTRTSAVAPIDYSALARGIDISESHSAIAEL